MDRVFCIGLNKTGTSSLHEALKILGYNSVHAKTKDGINIKKRIKENYYQGSNILSGLESYNAFSDWDLDDSSHLIFKEFYNQYPDSKFILNTRDLESWLNSREKHVLRNQKKKQKDPSKNITWLLVDRVAWQKHFERHHNSVLKFFSDKPGKLLVYDISKNEGWEPLCNFLGCPIPSVVFPRKNVSPNLIKKVFRIIKSTFT